MDNPSRRDLLKQLTAMGMLATISGLPSAGSYAAQSKKYTGSLNSKTTRRDDSGYEDLRREMLWKSNTSIRYPDLIVQAKSEKEIIAALDFAAKNDLQVVSRCSGHNTAGAVLRNGGMLLDISSMGDMTVDAKHMTATVQPGLRMYPFFEEISKHGLVFPVADCYTVAIGGYLLGGGHSPIGHYWGQGPACYSIISAEVILANGEKVTANKTQHPDLYWAVRGIGPGFFGVITRYQLQLYTPPATIFRSTYSYPIEALPKVLSLLDEQQETINERITINIALDKHPQSPDLIIAILTITVFTDQDRPSEEQAKTVLSDYVKNGISRTAITKQENRVIPFTDLLYGTDRSNRTNTDNIWTNDSRALSTILEHYRNKPPASRLILSLSHSRQIFPFRDDACYSSTGAHFLTTHMQWRDAKDDEANNQWYEEFNKILQPYTSSHYINQVDNERHPQRIKQCFSQANWQRLAEVRKKYDPDKRFFTYLGYT